MAASQQIQIFDTTLRDGEQSPGVSLGLNEKLEIANQLSRLGVDVIEAGFPIASPGELNTVRVIAENIKGLTVAGLARAVDADIDAAWDAVKDAEKPRIHTFIATSDIHLEHKLKKSRDEVIAATIAAVSRAKGYCEDIEFSPEDATRSDPDFMCQVCEAAIDSGATVINIPDTVGYALPHEYGTLIRTVFDKVPNIRKAIVSTHCHNDLGVAVANSLAGVVEGARQVECTINGIGERAGNASLEEIAMALYTRREQTGYCTGLQHEQILRSSRMVSDLTGMFVQSNKAVVGQNAFRHESGIHVHGMLSNPLTYEIMNPETIGLHESGIVLGKHSGRHGLAHKTKELGYELAKEQLDTVYGRFLEVADRKHDVTDADIESIVADVLHGVEEIYTLDHIQVVCGKGTVPSATVRIRTNDRDYLDNGTGIGPIDALYKAIDQVITQPHKLIDFRIGAVSEGTDAIGEVIVKVEDENGSNFVGRGSSTDIIDAAARAYMQALNRLATRAQN